LAYQEKKTSDFLPVIRFTEKEKGSESVKGDKRTSFRKWAEAEKPREGVIAN